MDQDNDQPVIMLRAPGSDEMLPIWIGPSEAQAILWHFSETPPPRPMTHDLLFNVIRALGFLVERVEITDLREGTFFANIVLYDGANTIEIDARPSDSIALALRAGAAILVDEQVMKTASRPMPTEDEIEEQRSQADNEREVEEFREFLATIDPDDFAGSS
jgi:bifunctional DNase/RNase